VLTNQTVDEATGTLHPLRNFAGRPSVIAVLTAAPVLIDESEADCIDFFRSAFMKITLKIQLGNGYFFSVDAAGNFTPGK
jgi:hypothetical protein